MKKRVRTILIFVVVAGLAFLAWKLSSQKDNNTKLADHALSDFAVADTAHIDQIVMTDTEGNKGVTLIRDGGTWKSATGECIQQHLVQTILETIRRVKVKSPVGQATIETVNKNLTAHHRKVEIYVSGKLNKVWYIGNPTPDHHGTYMLLKDPELGKSPEPFIMHMPGLHGSLQTRFITNPLEFECTGIFNYDVLNIAWVDVCQPDSAHQNFRIKASGKNNFSLFSNGKSVNSFDTAQVRDYLLGFQKIHFENHNYEYDEKNVDSLRNETPYFTIEVCDKQQQRNKVLIYRRRYHYVKIGMDGLPLEWDQDRCWVFLKDGRLVVGQYFVFDKLLRSLDWFTVAN